MRPKSLNISLIYTLIINLCFIVITNGKDAEYTVVVEPAQRACFYAPDIQAGSKFEIEYQVIEGGDYDVNFILHSPSGGVLLSELKKTDNLHKVDAKETGDYQFCFDNTFSRFTRKLVFFEVSTDQPDPTQDWSKLSVIDAEIDIKLEDFRLTMDKVKQNLEKTTQIQRQLSIFEIRDRSTQEANYDRVNRWSVVQLAVMITVGVIQIVLIRSLFDEKSKVRKIFQFTERTG